MAQRAWCCQQLAGVRMWQMQSLPRISPQVTAVVAANAAAQHHPDCCASRPQERAELLASNRKEVGTLLEARSAAEANFTEKYLGAVESYAANLEELRHADAEEYQVLKIKWVLPDAAVYTLRCFGEGGGQSVNARTACFVMQCQRKSRQHL